MTDRQLDIAFYATLVLWGVACFVLSGCLKSEKALDSFMSPTSRCATAIIYDKDPCSLSLVTICPDGVNTQIVPLEQDTTWVTQ